MTNDIKTRVTNAFLNGQDLRPIAKSETDQLFEILKRRKAVIARLMMASPDDDKDAAFTKLVLNYVYIRILLSEGESEASQ